MQAIQQILLNNTGQRLTPELINGMYHGIDAEVKKLLAAEAAKATQPAATELPKGPVNLPFATEKEA